MKRLLSFTGILLLASLMPGCAAQGDRPDQMVEAAKQLDQHYAEAFNKGDLDGVMANYWNSPDLVVFPPDEMQVKGWAAVSESIGNVMKSITGAKLEMIESHYTPLGDVVIGWGLWKLSFPDSHGAVPDMFGRYSNVSTKKDGKWVLILDHISEPQTLPAKS